MTIDQAAPGKVLRGRGRHREPGVRHVVRFPPVELDDALGPHAPELEVRADPERGHERHVAPGELADGRVVEVVVVVVRDDHEVQRRHRAKGNGHGLEALGAGEPRWRRARSPDRIGEHAQAVDLDQHRRMAEPGGAQSAGGRLAPGFERAHRRQRPPRHAPFAATEKFCQRRHLRVRVAQPRHDRVQVAEALAGPAQRGFDPLEPQACRSSAE
jgi:hypothetical protein